MSDLIPNTPQKRIDYVVKTYRGTKNERIIPDVIAIAFHTVGLDALGREWESAIGWPLSQYYNGDPTLLFSRWREWSGGDNPHGLNQALYEVYSSHWARSRDVVDPEAYASDLLDAALGAIHWPTRHPLDFIIPWTARELGSLAKEVRKGTASWEDDYLVAVQYLRASATAIAMWAKENSIDLTKTSLAEALEAIKDFEVDVDVTQGTVVHEWPDGWTVQALRSQEELDDEGEAMQHCIAGYCAQVRSGSVVIYSIRDPKGRPHVTMEWRAGVPASIGRSFESSEFRDPQRFIRSAFAKVGAFAQIQGKQNVMPKIEYRRRVHDFIDACFGGDLLGKLLAPIPGEVIDASGRTFEYEDFAGMDVFFDDIDFSNSTFIECQFGGMNDVNFAGATFNDCEFHGTIHGSSFDDAKFDRTYFRGDRIEQCSMIKAHFERSRLGGYISESDLSYTAWRFSEIGTSSIVDSSLQGASFEGGALDRVAIIRTDVRHLVLERTRVEQLWLNHLDLTQVDVDTARLLRKGSYGMKDGVVGARDVTWPEALAGAAE